MTAQATTTLTQTGDAREEAREGDPDDVAPLRGVPTPLVPKSGSVGTRWRSDSRRFLSDFGAIDVAPSTGIHCNFASNCNCNCNCRCTGSGHAKSHSDIPRSKCDSRSTITKKAGSNHGPNRLCRRQASSPASPDYLPTIITGKLRIPRNRRHPGAACRLVHRLPAPRPRRLPPLHATSGRCWRRHRC
jgi:hypothetical protein